MHRLGDTVETLRFLTKSRISAFAFAVVVGILVLATTADLVSPYSYHVADLAKRLMPPSLHHPLGTDQLGRDILSRIIHGTRVLLYVMSMSLLVALPLGTVLGLLSGFYGGVIDHVASRIIDILLSFPTVFLALAIVAVMGPSLENATLAIGISQAPIYMRLVRGQVLSERERLYVESARAIGAGGGRIMFRHILPNLTGPIIVQATFNATAAIISAAALSFLGLGAQPPTPCWGAMLYEAKDYLRTAPHAIALPGLALFIVAYALNTFGEALRDYMDPRMKLL